MGRPDWGAKGEDGEDYGMIYFLPVEEVKASDRVSEQLKGVNGGAGAGSHGFGVRVPAEVILEVDTKISDRVGPLHREDPAAQEP